uniref:Uncharacterized protein n=1 Tax=Salarias fasciatus TaxID=181472 RepID=A0A672JBA7_SALFA
KFSDLPASTVDMFGEDKLNCDFCLFASYFHHVDPMTVCAAFGRLFLGMKNVPTTGKYSTGIHVSFVVITSQQKTIGLTVGLQLPVAVHLSLSLNPVAAVCPQSGLGLSDYSSAWGEAGQQLGYGHGRSDSRDIQGTHSLSQLLQLESGVYSCAGKVLRDRETHT